MVNLIFTGVIIGVISVMIFNSTRNRHHGIPFLAEPVETTTSFTCTSVKRIALLHKNHWGV